MNALMATSYPAGFALSILNPFQKSGTEKEEK